MSITTASASGIGGVKARKFSVASNAGGQQVQSLAPGWSTNGATGYSVTGPGVVVSTRGVTALTLDGVSKLTGNESGLVYLPFASTAVITGEAHGIYTSKYTTNIAIPTGAVKTSSVASHSSTGTQWFYVTATTGGGFLWSVSASGSISLGNNGDGTILWYVQHNGASTGGADRNLWSGSVYRSTGSGGFNTGGGGAGMMFPFDGTLKFATYMQGAAWSGSSTLTAIWSPGLP